MEDELLEKAIKEVRELREYDEEYLRKHGKTPLEEMCERPTMDRDELKEIITKRVSERFVYNGVMSHYPPDVVVGFILSLLAPELDKLKRLQHEAHLLAMFVLQSPYYKDPDVREVVDNVLGLTMVDVIKGEVKDA